MKKRRQNPEQVLHMAVADYLTRALSIDDGVWWTTFPAGGGGKVRGAFLKRMGLKTGVWDIMIVYHGMPHWIELKATKGRLSEAQCDTINDLGKAGCMAWEVCRSLDDVEEFLISWAIPIRARLA